MRTRGVRPGRWRVYLKKADEFGRLAADAAAREDWNAVGLAAVHTVISAADALTAFHLGERSASQDHGDSVELVRRLPLEGAAERAARAAEVLDAKNVVEYEDRDFGPKEGSALQKKAERFLLWVHANLPAP